MLSLKISNLIGWIRYLMFLGLLFIPKRRVFFIVAAIFLIPSLYEWGMPPNKIAFAGKEDVQLYSGANKDNPVIATLKLGDRLPIIKTDGEWIAVSTKPGAKLYGLKTDFIIVN